MAKPPLLACRARHAAVLVLGASIVVACSSPSVDIPNFNETKSGRLPPKRTPSADAGTTPPGDGNDPGSSTPGPDAPTLTSVSPDSAPVGSGGLDLTLTGSRFVAGSKVDLAGTRLDAVLSSPTELNVHVPAAQLTAARVLRLTVVSPTKGESNALSFTVSNPTSVTITGLSPSNAVLGTSNVALTVTGKGFISTSTIRFNGASVSTTFRSATELGATLPSAALLQAGRFGVTVTSGNDVVSLPSQFEVRNPSPQLSSVSPNSVEAGSAATVLTINGNDFTRASEVFLDQTPLATTLLGMQSLRATVPASLLAGAGTRALRVQTPTPGGGTSTTLTFTVTAVQKSTCTYTCAEYGYLPGECDQGWACNGATGCMYQTQCTGGGGGGAQCLYRCVDYGYAPGQCLNGWYCLPSGAYAGCLGQTPC